MSVLVVGLGSIGTRHAEIFRQLGAEVVAGMDPDADRRRRFEANTGAVTVENLDEALTLGPSLAIIASPSRFHIEQATRCAEAGCHLLIEKPLGTDMEGTTHLAEQVERRGLFAHVGSNFKFHPALIRMKELLNQESIGSVTGAQVLAGQWLPGWHPDEDYRLGYSARADLGGGIVLDTHEFDCLTWLLGPVEELVSFTTRSGALELDTEDVACACLRFSSGALGTLHIDYIQRDYRRRYHISGDEGTIEWDFSTGQLTIYSASAGRATVENVDEDLNEMYVRQARHVLEGIAGHEVPVTPIRHAISVLDLQLRVRATHA